MPSSSSPGKHALFSALAGAERAVRGKQNFGPTELREIRNFLVLQYESPLGSVVHVTPLFEALKLAIPDAHITVATSPMAASVLGSNPFIDRCVVTPDPFTHFVQALAAVRDLLRGLPGGPRCIVTAIGNQRTRLAMLALFSGRAARVGYTLAPEIYHLVLPFVPERGQIAGNLDIVRALGYSVEPLEPRVFYLPSDLCRALEMLRSLPDGPLARIAFVTQNSGGQRNQWKRQRFVETISNLCPRGVAVPVFLGTEDDTAPIEILRHQLPNSGLSLAGKTTISQLAAVLAQCDLIVSLDTGTFHVARAVGLPGIVLAPAWQDPREWLPVGNPSYRILRGPSIPAAPPDYCLDEIKPEHVVSTARELLNRFPPSQSRRSVRLEACLRKPRRGALCDNTDTAI